MRILTALLLALALSAPAFAQEPARSYTPSKANRTYVNLVTVDSVDGDNVVAGSFKFSAKRFGLQNLQRAQLLVVLFSRKQNRVVDVFAQRPSPNDQTR